MSNTQHDLTGQVHDLISIPDIAANAATNLVAVWIAPYKCKVSAVNWIPTDAITGDNTNSFSLALLDVNASTELASKAYITGVNATAGEVVILYAPASADAVADNGVLRLKRTLVGSTGLATPCSVLEVVFQGD